jgi:hypothetical protein
MGWKFCNKVQCLDRAPVPGLRDELSARAWLRRAAGDPSAMAAIRTFLAVEMGARNLYNDPDEAVVAQMARLLATGQVHVHELQTKKRSLEDSEPRGVPKISGAKPVPALIPASRPRVPTRAYQDPPVEAPTFSNVNAAAQAAVLAAAAADGRPFCPE